MSEINHMVSFFLTERSKYHILKPQSLYLMKFDMAHKAICCKFATRPEKELKPNVAGFFTCRRAI